MRIADSIFLNVECYTDLLINPSSSVLKYKIMIIISFNTIFNGWGVIFSFAWKYIMCGNNHIQNSVMTTELHVLSALSLNWRNPESNFRLVVIPEK